MLKEWICDICKVSNNTDTEIPKVCHKCGCYQIKYEAKIQKLWVCNECNLANFTESVPEQEIELELHACINCGGFEFHLEDRIIE